MVVQRGTSAMLFRLGKASGLFLSRDFMTSYILFFDCKIILHKSFIARCSCGYFLDWPWLQVEIRYWEAAFVITLSLAHPFVYTKFYHLEAGGQRKYPTTKPKIKGLNLRTRTAGEKKQTNCADGAGERDEILFALTSGLGSKQSGSARRNEVSQNWKLRKDKTKRDAGKRGHSSKQGQEWKTMYGPPHALQ